MKKLLNSIKEYSLGIIVGSIIGIAFTVYANSISSSSVTYSHSLTSQTTVKGTLDELISETHACKTTCPKGYTCTPKVCKRAKSLHTETCNNTSGYCGTTRGNGATITYGNRYTTAGLLKTGDAFDCDVVGDGSYEYEGQTARFYYVSTMNNGHGTGTDSSRAVLVYYSNIDRGHIATTNSIWTSNDNRSGPDVVVSHLPGNAPNTWPRVSLSTTERVITNENGSNTISSFNYGNANARLLTFQEVNAGCKNGYAITTVNGIYQKCEFLFENTKYTNSSRATDGPWLETPYSGNTSTAWYATSYSRNVNYGNIYYTNAGVRPAIEVPLSEISY